MCPPSASGWGCSSASPCPPDWGERLTPSAPWANIDLPTSEGDELLCGQLREEALGEQAWSVALCVLMGLVLMAALWRGRRYLAYRLRGLFATERRFARTGDFTAARTIPLFIGLLLVGSASGALILTQCLPYGVWSGERWTLWLLCLGVLAGGLCLKVGAYGIVGWTFLPKAMRRAWMGAYLLLTACLAVPLFVLCVLSLRGLMEVATTVGSALFLLILYEILLFYRMYSNFPRQIGGQVLAFVYLCTLEIAPLLAAGRFLSILSEV